MASGSKTTTAVALRTAEEQLELLEQMMREAAAQGLILRTADDEQLDGRTIGLDGRPMLNFASCSYLGLELDPRMRAGVCEAVMRYGTQFSSSRSYLQAPAYLELEERLGEMFGAHALVVPSTTLGHAAALPVLVGSQDAVILDQHVHHSVQMAVNHVRVQGTHVEMIRHSDLDQLEAALARLSGHQRVWYFADGVYSMFADLAPFAELGVLLERHERLHLYIDDSHGVGWSGLHGRGPALERLGMRERVIVAASLNKSFAAAGAALLFPSEELKDRVRLLGGPMIFSGPVQPPMLGAALASVRIHLSDEIREMQAALQERIDLCTRLLAEFCLPVTTKEPTPIRFIPVGLPQAARELTRRLLDEGLYTNIATFPAVPMKQAGVRFTLTLHHQPADITRLVQALARHIPTVADAPATAGAPLAHTPAPAPAGPPALRLEHHRTIHALNAGEWDRLLGDRGSFTADGLKFLERAFGRDRRPEDHWSFHYYLVRDAENKPVLATWFTEALWKDDMLSPAAVSALVEQRRREDAYYLTSRTFAMGSLLTEGDHLYLDRDGDWKGALRLLTGAIAQQAKAATAGTLVIRDIAAEDTELGEALSERGFVRVELPASHTIANLAEDDDEWLAGLSPRARAHQRREVLPRESSFEVEILRRGSRIPSDSELEQLHQLYRNVRERSLEINSFELPPTLLADMLAHDCWELMLLRLHADGERQPTTSPPVAFGAHFIGQRHYAPILIGLDYDYVLTHGSYRQCLRQALLRARANGADTMMLGMGAPLEKHRLGATPNKRFVYAQTNDHYSHQVLADLETAALTPSDAADPCHGSHRRLSPVGAVRRRTARRAGSPARGVGGH
jgi:7-keto-8-aminopelargonate synthetase-like enzyme